MRYGFLLDFMYDVGRDVGVFLSEEEKNNFSALGLAEIVKNHVEERNFINIFFLRKQIRRYIQTNMTPDGLAYSYPFDYELAFPEDYFEGDLYAFLTSVLALLEKEQKARRRRFF